LCGAKSVGFSGKKKAGQEGEKGSGNIETFGLAAQPKNRGKVLAKSWEKKGKKLATRVGKRIHAKRGLAFWFSSIGNTGAEKGRGSKTKEEKR